MTADEHTLNEQDERRIWIRYMTARANANDALRELGEAMEAWDAACRRRRRVALKDIPMPYEAKLAATAWASQRQSNSVIHGGGMIAQRPEGTPRAEPPPKREDA